MFFFFNFSKFLFLIGKIRRGSELVDLRPQYQVCPSCLELIRDKLIELEAMGASPIATEEAFDNLRCHLWPPLGRRGQVLKAPCASFLAGLVRIDLRQASYIGSGDSYDK